MFSLRQNLEELDLEMGHPFEFVDHSLPSLRYFAISYLTGFPFNFSNVERFFCYNDFRREFSIAAIALQVSQAKRVDISFLRVHDSVSSQPLKIKWLSSHHKSLSVIVHFLSIFAVFHSVGPLFCLQIMRIKIK